MNQIGWDYLIARWEAEDFKKLSERNKKNRASSKGGALHTTGRKAHHDIAFDMVCIQPVLTLCNSLYLNFV
jgi:hypothetical protein